MALSASWQKGMSFDEGLQIATGYNIWLRNDLRIEASNGDLVKRWATLPLLLSKPAFPPVTDADWRAGRAYRMAFTFFFEQGNDPRDLLRQCRAMVLVFGVATGLLVFFWSRDLFGNRGGLISLTLFVSSSSMLVFGAMVSTEMTVCCALLGSVWCLWRLLHGVTWGRVLSSLVFLGLLLLSKLSCVLILPLTALLVAVKLAGGRPLEWRLGSPRWFRRGRPKPVFLWVCSSCTGCLAGRPSGRITIFAIWPVPIPPILRLLSCPTATIPSIRRW
jgi:hypothetical protein